MINFKKFTDRELEVLSLISQGLTAEEVAVQLELSKETIRTYRKKLLNKSKCKNIVELVAISIRKGVIK